MRVIIDDAAKRFLLPVTLLGFQSVLFELSRQQIAFCDLQLLAFGITRQRNNLHAIAQRLRHGIDVIGRGDENDLGQIERHVEIAIDKGKVLPQVEHFE